MAAARQLSTRNAGVRRLLQEATELSDDTCPDYTAAPLEDDLFTWHFTIRGPGGDFEGGVYHGKLVLPSEYPFKPPAVYMLTPSGRFETNKPICLSISSFHPESWQPSWGVRTALVALSAFFASEPQGAVGSLNAPPAERQRLAKSSHTFNCPTCGFSGSDHLLPTPAPAQTEQAEAPLLDSAPAPPPIFPSPSPRVVQQPNIHLGGGREEGMGAPPQMPVLQQLPEPQRVVEVPREGAQGAVRGMEGGAPLWIDRVILVVLMALLALVVRKLA